MALRRLYVSRSKAGASCMRTSWSLRYGITSSMARSRSQARMRGTLMPRSPARRAGHLRSPASERVRGQPSSTGARYGLSLACPATSSAARGRPSPSESRSRWLPQPPRLLPSAWSAGSPLGLFFPRRPRSGPVRPDMRAVVEKQLPVHAVAVLHLALQRLEQRVKDPGLSPPPVAAVDRRPRPVALGQIPPGSARAQNPENAVQDRPIILPGPPRLRSRRQQRLDHTPLSIAQLMTSSRNNQPSTSGILQLLKPHYVTPEFAYRA